MQIRSIEHKQLKFLRSNKTFQIQHYTELNLLLQQNKVSQSKIYNPIDKLIYQIYENKIKSSEKLQRSVLSRPPHTQNYPSRKKRIPTLLNHRDDPKTQKAKTFTTSQNKNLKFRRTQKSKLPKSRNEQRPKNNECKKGSNFTS